jgi:tungstate transport system permease protein
MSTFSESATTALALIVSFDTGLWTVVGRSLAVSATACAIACGIGLVAGAWLGVARFPGRDAVLTVLNTLLALPSVVVGLLVYLLLSRAGPLGFPGLAVQLQGDGAWPRWCWWLPVVTALTRQVVADAGAPAWRAAASLGAGRVLRGLLLAWDERFALLTVLLASSAAPFPRSAR